MSNKKAIVTGASRGIGRGIARKLASLGYDLAISYNSKEAEAKAVKEELESKYGIKCYYYQASLDKRGVGEALFEKAVADLGGLDLLVNNAGQCIVNSIVDMPDEDIDYLIDLDFRNYIMMIRCAARYMRANNIQGSIVNITSSRGERAYPGDAVYGGRISKSVAGMEKDEQKGMSPQFAGRYIAKIALKGHVKPVYTVGFGYKCLSVLCKLLPCGFRNWIVGLLYAR